MNVLLDASGRLPDAVPGGGLMLGAMLFVAIVGGYGARIVRLPRVVGYMLAGVALKLGLTWYLSIRVDSAGWTTADAWAHEAGASLGPLNSLALGLILFTIGGVFDRQHLKRVGGRIWRVSAAEIGGVFGLVLVGCWVAAMIEGVGTRGEQLGLGLLLAAAATATAPAATLLVLQEYEAKGPTSDAILVLTGLNNIISIVLFHVGFLVLVDAGTIELAVDRSLWLDLLLTTVGSAALGVVLGIVMTLLHARLTVGETLMIFFATLLVLGAGDVWIKSTLQDAVGLSISFNFLLVALFMGVVFTNAAVHPERLVSQVGVVAMPVFAVFFVLAGYNLHVEQVPELKWLGGAYVVFRLVGKSGGGWLGTRWAGLGEHVKPHLGLALLCQAGVAIGLGTFLLHNWYTTGADGAMMAHPLASRAYTVILAAVVIFEILGPLAVKWTAVQSGEIKAVNLFPRSSGQGGTPLSVVVNGVAKLFGGAATAKPGTDPRDMTVKQLMRTNVKFIRPDASLEDVMHFVERSRFNSFPVVDEDGEFLGMIEFADIRDILYDPAVRDLIRAVDLARPDAPLVPLDMTLGDLFGRFHEMNVEAFPVVAKEGDRKVIGVVEQRDLLRTLHVESGKANRAGR